MVCMSGKGRHTTMVRPLWLGNYPARTIEEANQEKLDDRAIYKELLEADEPNLLKEEDMHVFDCKPLSDPLHLVCCNACKKPIKDSQYAAHAERCRSMNYAEEISIGLDGGTGHKKPPRKGRKKMQPAHDNQGTVVGEQERSDSIDGDTETVASESNVDDHTGMASSLSTEAKRAKTPKDSPLGVDASGINGSANHSAGALSRPKKYKMINVALLPQSIGGKETVCGVLSEAGRSCVTVTCDGAPIPLATKMYHSKRNGLRAAIGHLYHEAAGREIGFDSLDSANGNLMLSSPISSPTNLLEMKQKCDTFNASAARNPDQLLAQNSELCLGASEGYPASVSFSNQYRAAGTTTTVTKTRYLPTTYSFPGNSGTSLGSVQQPNGSVSVI